jgi:hypothetical protein
MVMKRSVIWLTFPGVCVCAIGKRCWLIVSAAWLCVLGFQKCAAHARETKRGFYDDDGMLQFDEFLAEY